jgi:hypothetical protein
MTLINHEFDVFTYVKTYFLVTTNSHIDIVVILLVYLQSLSSESLVVCKYRKDII